MSEPLDAFFARYAACYAALDGDAVAALCAVPLTISQGGTLTCWTEAAPILANMRALCGVYREAGLAQATPELLQQHRLGAHDAFALVRWTLTRADGTLIQRFLTGYQLLHGAQGWRITWVTAFDESLDKMKGGTP